MRKVSLFLLNLGLAIVIGVSGVIAQTPGTYVVQRGDSLIKIAKKVGATVQALVDANKATYPCLATKLTCLQIGWVLTLPSATPSPTPTIGASGSSTAVTSDEYQDMRRAIAVEVNRLRTENGIAALSWDDTVAAFAQERSLDMTVRNYVSHYDPITGAVLARQLVTRRPYFSLCENIFGQWGRYISTVVRNAIDGWWNSPGHRQCMLMPEMSIIGIGMAQDARGGWLVTLLNVQPK